MGLCGYYIHVLSLIGASDSYIHFVEAFKPTKNLTLAYLHDAHQTFPKYAHVSLDRPVPPG